jgi:ABC-2 type transport system ATP-binding protein
MEEAEHLCDRVLVIHRGRIVALDTPENLVGGLGAETRILFTADRPFDLQVLRALSGVAEVERSGDRVTVTGQGDRLVVLVVDALDAQGVKFRGLRTEQPNLEDVFLTLTDEEAGS